MYIYIYIHIIYKSYIIYINIYTYHRYISYIYIYTYHRYKSYIYICQLDIPFIGVTSHFLAGVTSPSEHWELHRTWGPPRGLDDDHLKTWTPLFHHIFLQNLRGDNGQLFGLLYWGVTSWFTICSWFTVTQNAKQKLMVYSNPIFMLYKIHGLN